MAANESLMSSGSETFTKDTNPELGSVKFVPTDGDIEVSIPTKIIGLTKEQLEEYRNDPFWKYIRFFSFILFWIIWAAMFVGAILIVVLSPKCSGNVDTKSWFENSISYQLFVPTFYDSDGDGVGDYKGVSQKLDYLRKIGVNSIWPAPIIKTDKDDFDVNDVVDFDKIDERFGDEETLRQLIVDAHYHNIKFIGDIPLTISKKHKWLIEAQKNESSKYKQYFTNIDEGILNLSDSDVNENFLNVIRKVVDYGVDGVYLRNPKDIDGKSIGKLVESIKQFTPKDFVIYTDKSIIESTPETYSIYPIFTKSCSSRNLPKCIYSNVNSGINNQTSKKIMWNLLENESERLDNKFNVGSEKIVNLLTMLQFILPGPLKVNYGDEYGLQTSQSMNAKEMPIMSWNNDNHNGFSTAEGGLIFGKGKNADKVNAYDSLHTLGGMSKIFQKLGKLREREDILKIGTTDVILENGILYVYRYLENLSGKAYILALNLNLPTTLEKTIGIDDKFLINKENIQVVTSSYGFDNFIPRENIEIKSGSVTLKPMEGILLRV
ncbi:Neutral and basic amino acid transport protein rBAT [Strongyloides ratti]|uniref:Neutral and basic amino acid transport protein rBAT n=1 Tax=Strongyloides ratti TaxID=34506 RepID=A0A090LLJ5_STRRB|nr:Neutral and basic amino acid transport protein rBAT [Strongyloides ratti]CEF70590.1 Neutral and basic amino acid transport protein rBAT [Strongyloides ratti]